MSDGIRLELPSITVYTSDAEADPSQLLRLILAFGVALVHQNGDQIVVSKEQWRRLEGRHVHINFYQDEDRFVVKAEVGDVVQEPDQSGAIPISDDGPVDSD